MNKHIKYILLAALAVFAGGLLYILFRPTEVIFLKWLQSLGNENWLQTVRGLSLPVTSFLPEWMVYSLPNGLWAFAYTLIILRIWNGNKTFIKYFWYLSIPVLVFGFELLQLTGNLRGTFCRIDLLWGAVGIAFGLLTSYKTTYNLTLTL